MWRRRHHRSTQRRVLLAWVILLLVLVLLWFLLKDFFAKGILQKLVVLIFLMALGGALGVYTYKQDQINQTHMALERAFLRGDELECKGVKVNSKTFSLVRKTLSFLGKQNTSMQGILVQLRTCKIL
ncbi:hypothetical protein [Helicobacter suis]|uniref:hypothetical protein n=1 Tax=Helicobacter suis TaxID=104628 RepID=UPI0013D6F059